MSAAVLVLSVYALGLLTIISFIVFTILLLKYLFGRGSAPVAKSADELQDLNIGEILKQAKELLVVLNKAKPVAISALVTIFFLLAWLFALSLLVSSQISH